MITKADPADHPVELRAEFADLRAEMRAEFAKVRTEPRAEMGNGRGEIAELRGKFPPLYWTLGLQPCPDRVDPGQAAHRRLVALETRVRSCTRLLTVKKMKSPAILPARGDSGEAAIACLTGTPSG